MKECFSLDVCGGGLLDLMMKNQNDNQVLRFNLWAGDYCRKWSTTYRFISHQGVKDQLGTPIFYYKDRAGYRVVVASSTDWTQFIRYLRLHAGCRPTSLYPLNELPAGFRGEPPKEQADRPDTRVGKSDLDMPDSLTFLSCGVSFTLCLLFMKLGFKRAAFESESINYLDAWFTGLFIGIALTIFMYFVAHEIDWSANKRWFRAQWTVLTAREELPGGADMKENLCTMKKCGFTDQKLNIRALVATSNNLEAAIEQLVGEK